MDRESLVMEIKVVLISSLGSPLDPSAIGEGNPLWENGLNVGSLAAIEILTVLEDRFGVQFPDEMIDSSLFASVGRLVEAVSSLLINSADPKAHETEH